jgi:hypothetical protein
MIIQLKQLRDVEIAEHRDTEDTTIRIIEKDGSFSGGLSEIIVPATSYKMLETAIVEKWLEKKKDSI